MQTKRFFKQAVIVSVVFFLLASAISAAATTAADNPFPNGFEWKVGKPLFAAQSRPNDDIHSIKDPTVVFYDGRWHLFCTIRGKQRTHRIEYLSFTDWTQTDKAQRTILAVSDGYFCAPQVFYFAPQKLWYMIYQASDKTRKPQLQPVFSTTTDIRDPKSWTAPKLLFETQPEIAAWIDFWVICDQARAYLFFTSNNGKMWRSQTRLADFPRGFDQPKICIEADIFEAGHTYHLKGQDRYLTVVEAQAGGRRYYKAYLADRLDGDWKPLADTLDKPFAGLKNTTPDGDKWTDSFSHGELLRDGYDQTLTVDPAKLRFLFQGVSDSDKAGKNYGDIPWRLGLLEEIK
jgi:hypothetical protein